MYSYITFVSVTKVCRLRAKSVTGFDAVAAGTRSELDRRWNDDERPVRRPRRLEGERRREPSRRRRPRLDAERRRRDGRGRLPRRPPRRRQSRRPPRRRLNDRNTLRRTSALTTPDLARATAARSRAAAALAAAAVRTPPSTASVTALDSVSPTGVSSGNRNLNQVSGSEEEQNDRRVAEVGRRG